MVLIYNKKPRIKIKQSLKALKRRAKLQKLTFYTDNIYFLRRLIKNKKHLINIKFIVVSHRQTKTNYKNKRKVYEHRIITAKSHLVSFRYKDKTI